MPCPRQRTGFTLVELAVVMTIIGILIAGVLKGADMAENARVTRTVKDLGGYRAATLAFKSQFSQLPGDMANALARLPNCTTSTNFCVNGNGDSVIGWKCHASSDQAGAAGMGAGYMASCDGTTPNVPQDVNIETTMFFKHLALADYISSVVTSADPATPEWGRTHPAAPFGGGYHTQHTWSSGTGSTPNGQWMRLQGPVTGNPWNFARPGTQPLTPKQAFKIDSKMDDGIADSGFVMTLSSSAATGTGGPGCGSATATASSGYELSVTAAVCVLYSKLIGD